MDFLNKLFFTGAISLVLSLKVSSFQKEEKYVHV